MSWKGKRVKGKGHQCYKVSSGSILYSTPVLFPRFMPYTNFSSFFFLILSSHQTPHFLYPSSMHLTIRLSHWSECSASQNLSICPNSHSNTSSWMFYTIKMDSVPERALDIFHLHFWIMLYLVERIPIIHESFLQPR